MSHIDPAILYWAARRGAFTPILVSVWFLVRLWRGDELFGKTGVVLSSWWVLATITQLFASASGVWLTALLAQVALAIVLVLKQQMSDII
jgi:hypothetical protein